MRWSSLFIPTLRDAPADAEAASHRLLVQGGFIRQLFAGHYTMLPLGLKVRRKVADIVRAEMAAIGGQEFLMPAMNPAAIWQASGRWDSMGENMFRLQDRSGADLAMGVTAEEIFATTAAEITSYKQLPQIWFQIQTKFRDEARPKSGLLRVREFAMKDSYSFDLDEAGLDASFDRHHTAYTRIFERFDLDAIPVEASSGNMGGSDSVEFMVATPAGEDVVVRCPKCHYAANIEKARAAIDNIDDGPAGELERFATPGVRTIAALESFDGGAPADRQIKTMVYVIDDAVTLALVRGDHKINEQKLADASGAVTFRPAESTETQEHLGAQPGSLGAVAVDGIRIIADPALRGRVNMTTGANDDDWHYRGVSVARDVAVGEWADLREVSEGESCIECGTVLEFVDTIEAGHIFKLGRKYAETFGATVLDADGKAQTIIMGSYGIGIDRAVATIAETHHDDKGIRWPISVAPYEVVITIVSMKDETSRSAGEALYRDLLDRGVDVLLDDRDARAGVKFADAELIGIPLRITIGPKSLAEGDVEVAERGVDGIDRQPIAGVVDDIAARVFAARG